MSIVNSNLDTATLGWLSVNADALREYRALFNHELLGNVDYIIGQLSSSVISHETNINMSNSIIVSLPGVRPVPRPSFFEEGLQCFGDLLDTTFTAVGNGVGKLVGGILGGVGEGIGSIFSKPLNGILVIGAIAALTCLGVYAYKEIAATGVSMDTTMNLTDEIGISNPDLKDPIDSHDADENYANESLESQRNSK